MHRWGGTHRDGEGPDISKSEQDNGEIGLSHYSGRDFKQKYSLDCPLETAGCIDQGSGLKKPIKLMVQHAV